MLESTACGLSRPGRSVTCAAVAATAASAASAASAEVATASGTLGPWLFASVALVLVAVASYLAGSRRAGPRAAQPQRPEGTAPEPATAPTPDPVQPGVLFGWTAALAEDVRPALLLVDDGNGGPRRLVQANPAALRQLGLDRQDIGRHWAELAQALPVPLRDLLAAGANGPHDAIEGWWLLRDRTGHALLALGGADDGRSNDDASLGYTVSHDLRAPIRVVEGFTRIVKEDYGQLLDRIGNDHLDRVLAAAARMNQMIDAMLTMARLSSQPLVRQPVDLTQLAGFVIDDLRRSAPERDVEIDIEPGMRAAGDPTLLRLVLENLLGNAWKYSEHSAPARIQFVCHADHGQHTYLVRDNGAGFDMRVADRLFGLFQRLHSAKDFPGTGVGLASVRRIVQRHGGQVWAEAAPGKGATFHFTLRE